MCKCGCEKRPKCCGCEAIKRISPIGTGISEQLPAVALLNIRCHHFFHIDCLNLLVDNNQFSSVLLDTLPDYAKCITGKPITIIFDVRPDQQLYVLFSNNFNNIAEIDYIKNGPIIRNSKPCITLISDCTQFSILNTSIGWIFDEPR